MAAPIRILLVEDNEDDAFLIERELQKGGYHTILLRVQTEADIESALQDQHWDLVITDHNIPGCSSHAALEILQRMEQDIPIIIVSGSIGEEIAVAAMKLGAHDYIMKENLARLVPAIEREIREAELRRSHRMAEATIRHLAYHDPLTGLVNRNEFDRRLSQALESAQRDSVHHVLLYLDLDQFKVINDTCGHQAGDQLLSQLAVVLRGEVRGRDTLARLGGDEFGLLLENCAMPRAEQVAESIRSAVRNFRFVWQNKTFSVGVSIGLAAVLPKASNAAEVLSAADMACYTAKDMGRDRLHIYKADDAEMRRRQGEIQWVARVKEALDEGHFVLHQQSIQSLNSDSLPHYEIFVRMLDAAGDIILPGAFIPAAERYGMIAGLDRWVVRSVITHLKESYMDAGNEKAPGLFFVNLSGASLCERSLFDDIRDHLIDSGVPPHWLCFEITETAAISNLHRAVEFIHEIRHLGCHFALDDFGAGLSSFSYLKAIPVDYLKIDGGFVRDIAVDPMNYAIVQAVNQISHVAGLRTIAEYVEDEAILPTLKHIGIDYAQGFGIARPVPVQ
jgi:diguanylate cyclase (GGDEF)-like protein